MAISINAGDVKRSDYFFVDPFEVHIREDLRGRSTPPSDSDIIDLAESLVDNGQRTPVECRRQPDKTLLLNAGFTRTVAARLIRKGFKRNDTGEPCQDADFALKVILSDGNDKEAFIHNIVENAHRNATTAIDDAVNQRKLRDKYGYSDAEISRLYRYGDPARVGRLRLLLELPDEAQALIHKGKLGVQAAIDLLALPAEERDATLTAATDAVTGKVAGAKIRDKVRDNVLNDDGKKKEDGESVPPVAKKKALARTTRDVKKFVAASLEVEDADDRDKKLLKTLKLWLDGQRTDKKLLEEIAAHRS